MENVKRISKSKFEIEIKLTGKEVKDYLDKAINDEIKNVKEPGFRKGKMPKNMFIKKYGVESVYPTAVDLILNDIYPKIITENKISVVAQPEFDFQTMKISEKDGFEIKGVVDVYPEFDLPDYKNIKKNIKKGTSKVTKKEIKEQIDGLLAKDSKYEAKDDYQAKNGDIVVLDFEGFVDGVAFEGGKGESYSLTLGSNSFIPGFEEQLVGLKAGEAKDVEVTFPTEYQSEELAGKDAVFKCVINEVKKRTLPRLTDKKIKEFQEYTATTREELEQEVEKKLLEQKNVSIDAQYEKNILNALVKAAELEIPTSLIKQEAENTIKNLEENFKKQGIGLDVYLQMTGMNMDILEEQINAESKDRLESQILLEKFLETEEIKISKKEIDEYMKKVMEDYKLDKETLLKQIGGTTEPLERDLKYNKARDILFK